MCVCVSLSLFSLSFPIKRYLRPRREDFCTGTTSSTLSFSSSLFTGCCCCSASSMSASAASPSSAMVAFFTLLVFENLCKVFFVSKVRLFSEPGVELVFVLRVLFDPGVAPTSSESVSISSSSSNEVSVSVSLAAFLAAAFLSRSIFARFYPAIEATTSMKSFKFKERLSDSSTDSNCFSHTSKTFFASTCEIFGINADTA